MGLVCPPFAGMATINPPNIWRKWSSFQVLMDSGPFGCIISMQESDRNFAGLSHEFPSRLPCSSLQRESSGPRSWPSYLPLPNRKASRP